MPKTKLCGSSTKLLQSQTHSRVFRPIVTALSGPACAERRSTKRAGVAKRGAEPATVTAPVGQRSRLPAWCGHAAWVLEGTSALTGPLAARAAAVV